MFTVYQSISNKTKMDEFDTRSEGCQVEENGKICGETETLKIIREFQQLYENKLKEIDEKKCSGDKTKQKMQMLQSWVYDLTDQNVMLVQAVEELEKEASERVKLLEEKLQQSSKTAYGTMISISTEKPNQKQLELQVYHLKSDLQNVLQILHRARETGVWDVEGLSFHQISIEDIFMSGDCCCIADKKVPDTESLKTELNNLRRNSEFWEKENGSKDRAIQELKHQLLIKNDVNHQKQVQDIQSQLEMSQKDNYRLSKELGLMAKQLEQNMMDHKKLLEEMAKTEKSAKDTRDALTAEVAEKHDCIRSLRHEFHQLEEQCRQIDKQAHFKDDIIKEMRKELRNYKQVEDQLAEIKVKYDQIEKEKSQFELQSNNDLEILKRKNEKLELKLSQMLQKSDACGANEKDCSTKIKDLNNCNDLLCKTIEKAEHDLKQVKMTAERYLQERDKAEKKLEYVESELASVQVQMSETYDQISFLSIQNRTLQEQLLQNCACDESLADCRLEERELPKKVKNDQKRVTDLEKNLQKSFEDKAKLEKIIVELKATINEITQGSNLNDTRIFEKKICDLETSLLSKEAVIENLQQAVYLHQNTITELEKQKTNAQAAKDHQQQTINGLQDALLSVKQQLSEVQSRNGNEVKRRDDLISTLRDDLTCLNDLYASICNEMITINQTTEKIRDSNLDLRSANFYLQQDNSILQLQLHHKQLSLSSFEGGCKALQKELQTRDTLLSSLKQTIDRCECLTLKSELLQKNNKIDELKNRLLCSNELCASAWDQLKTYQEWQRDYETLIEDLTFELSSAKGNLEYLQSFLESDDEFCLARSMTVSNLFRHVEVLEHELGQVQQQIVSESKLNSAQFGHIREMEQTLDEKQMEINRLEDVLMMTRNDLTLALNENKKMNQSIQELNDELCEQGNCIDSADKNTSCRLREKILSLKNLLQNKSEELANLQATYQMQVNENCILKCEIENEKASHIEESNKLKTIITKIEKKLCETEMCYFKASQDLMKQQKKIADSAQHEAALQKLLTLKETNLGQKEEQAMKMENAIIALDDNLLNYKTKLLDQEQELENLKVIISTKSQMISASMKETARLNDEIANLKQTIDLLQAENDKLTTDVSNEKTCQVDKYQMEMELVQNSNMFLEDRNIRIVEELNALRKEYDDLQADYRLKEDEVISLQMDLTEMSTCREEICSQSKAVISNARKWLQEQKEINQQLMINIQEKNNVIRKLQFENQSMLVQIQNLQQILNGNKCCSHSDNEKCHDLSSSSKSQVWARSDSYESEGIYSPPITPTSFEQEPERDRNDSCYWTGSNYVGSSDTTDSNFSDQADKYWINKVQNIYQELKKNNDYWKRKFSQMPKKSF